MEVRIDEVGGQDMTAIGNSRTIVVAKVAADLGDSGATNAAIRRIGGETV